MTVKRKIAKGLFKKVLNWIQTPLVSKSTATDAYYRAKNTTQGEKADVSFGVGSGGTNHGIYSHSMGRWLIQAGKDSGGNWKTYFTAADGSGASQLPYLFSVTEVTKTVSSLGTGYQSCTSNQVTKAGYYPLGIVGFDIIGTGTGSCYYIKTYLSARAEGTCTCFAGVRNAGSSSISATFHWYVLWIKFI